MVLQEYLIIFQRERREKILWGRLVQEFKHMFLVFKQHYMYFYTLFHPHVFSKNINNATRTTLPNCPTIFMVISLRLDLLYC